MRLDQIFDDPVAWDEARVAWSAFGSAYVTRVSDTDFEGGIRNPQNTQWLRLAYHFRSYADAHAWALRNLLEVGTAVLP